MNDQLGGHASRCGKRLRVVSCRASRRRREIAPDHKLSDVRFLPVIPNPEKIMCVGINYKSHAAEHGTEAPKLPNIFTRFVNTLVAHEGEMIRPKVSTSLRFRGRARAGDRQGRPPHQGGRCAQAVAGYTCFCDGTVRDFTKYSLVASKNFRHRPARAVDGHGRRNPRSDQADAPHAPQRQGDAASGTDMLIHRSRRSSSSVRCSRQLSPGDIIATGTPDGIGAKRNPPVWMKAGDVLEVEISGIGTLRNRIADET